MTKNDYYGVLGVPRDATIVQIKDAYKMLAKAHHPDWNPGNKDTKRRMQDINNAYEVLRSPNRRAMYDQFGFDIRHGSYGDIIEQTIHKAIDEFVNSIRDKMIIGLQRVILGGGFGALLVLENAILLYHNDRLPDILLENPALYAPLVAVSAMFGAVAGYKAVEGLQRLDSKYDLDNLFRKFGSKFYRRKRKDLVTILKESES